MHVPEIYTTIANWFELPNNFSPISNYDAMDDREQVFLQYIAAHRFNAKWRYFFGLP